MVQCNRCQETMRLCIKGNLETAVGVGDKKFVLCLKCARRLESWIMGARMIYDKKEVN